MSNLGFVSKAIAIISTLTSLGSIIVGVFSIWRHQTNTERPGTAVSRPHFFSIGTNRLMVPPRTVLLYAQCPTQSTRI